MQILPLGTKKEPFGSFLFGRFLVIYYIKFASKRQPIINSRLNFSYFYNNSVVEFKNSLRSYISDMIQNLFLVGFLVYSLLGFVIGFKNTFFRKNPYGHSQIFYLLGAFVWADSLVFGLFFALVSLVCLVLQNFALFVLSFSLFWAIRSIGEQFYWFLEQFSTVHKNPEHTLWVSRIFPRNSSWIALQTFWQCVSVVSIVSTVWAFFTLLKALA